MPILSAQDQVERLFDQCVRTCGGETVRELLPKNPSFENADYLFRNYHVVAELKCIREDTAHRRDTQIKAATLYNKWAAQGKVPPAFFAGLAPLNTRDLPEDCANELMKIARQPLHELIKKANRQIKKTKEHLRLPAAKGLLILVNEGNYTLESEAVLYFLERLLDKRCDQQGKVVRGTYRSIDNVIYLTVGMEAHNPVLGDSTEAWINCVRDDTRSISPELFERLGDAWFDMMARISGHPVRCAFFDDPRVVHHVRYTQAGRTPPV